MAKKTYVCSRWPNLQIRHVHFSDGEYTTANTDEQAIIENAEEYGVTVFLQGKAPQDEEPQEEAPTARQGRRGTSSLS